jgi:N-carbamoyl-L-amino-acid hydrolase
MPDKNSIAPEMVKSAAFFDLLEQETKDSPGVTRATYGTGESRAHALAAELAQDLELEVTKDFAGNQYMTLPGSDRAKPAIMIGSHLDSVPHGGNYDGAAGVIMGLAVQARLLRLGRRLRRDITVMAIRGEETCWFSTHYIGSRLAFGALSADEITTCRRIDTDRTLEDHMAEEGFDPAAGKEGCRHLDPERIRAFFEPHIEQGPNLIGMGIPVGIVTGIRGTLRYKSCRAAGEYNHAGAVPRELRRDAVFAATEFAQVLERHWDDRDRNGQDFVCTMGVFNTDADQHTMTKISGDVQFTMDMRSIDNDLLLKTDTFLREEADRIGHARGVEINLGGFANGKPAMMDLGLQSLLADTADTLGIKHTDMASGAGHDCSVFANKGVPSVMLFIRNENGSHNPDESMEMDDFEKTAQILATALDCID